jgi:hypothetical protein
MYLTAILCNNRKGHLVGFRSTLKASTGGETDVSEWNAWPNDVEI